jgi:hypothetical protein
MGDTHGSAQEQTYNPWTVVNVVFRHLAETGLHPTLGPGGDPGEHAARLLQALGVTPTHEGDSRVSEDVREELASLRAALMDEA